MILVFRGTLAPGTSTTFDAMLRDRKRVFVDMLGWDVPVVHDRYEIDQFDSETATYLVATDEDGAHHGSIRLLPTIDDHILGSIFPELCDAAVPRSATIQEISRGCVSPALRAPERRLVRNALTTAAVEYALGHGIEAYTCIADAGWLGQIPALGWDCSRLGRPMRIGRAMTGALRVDIRADTLHKLRAAGTYEAAALVFMDDGRRAAA